MMIKSCGILLYRNVNDTKKLADTEVFLIRANTPNELWGVPKGKMERGERPLQTAKREFREETGTKAPELVYTPLPKFVTRRGKVITVFVADAKTYDVRWVRKKVAVSVCYKNGSEHSFKETMDGQWFSLEEAYNKIGDGQKEILNILTQHLISHQNITV